MITTSELIDYTNRLLRIELFNDYCPNGLQVQGNERINKLITGVTACQALIDKAVAANADLLLVHHGFFWQGEPSPIVGMKAKRISTLMKHQINLAAYHLPLDAHESLGNNVQLGQRLAIKNLQSATVDNQPNLFWRGKLENEIPLADFVRRIETVLNRKPLVEAPRKFVNKVGWCTGGAQDYIFHAIEQGCDTYITGEVSERTIHIARENQINFISAGHHATERYGIKALGEHLAQKFGLDHTFIDIDNPA